MRFVLALASALLAACLPAFTLADFVSNDTAGYMEVDLRDLNDTERAGFAKVERKWGIELSKRGLSKRDCIPNYHKGTVLVGNGDPHQNYYFQQVTGINNCDGSTAGISYITSTTTTWSASISGTYSFITGGFSVSQSYTQGQSVTQNCSPLESEICIFQRVAYTAYTVQPQNCISGCEINSCTNTGHPIIFFAPNSNQFGGCFYKGTNNRPNCQNAILGCYGEHTGFWKKCGQAGGPPPYAVCGRFETKTCGVNCT